MLRLNLPLKLTLAVQASQVIVALLRSNFKPCVAAAMGPQLHSETETSIILTQLQATARQFNISLGVTSSGMNTSDEFISHVQLCWYTWLGIATKEIQFNGCGNENPCSKYIPKAMTLEECQGAHSPIKCCQVLVWKWALSRLR